VIINNLRRGFIFLTLTMIIPKKRVISSNDIAPDIHTIYLNFDLLTIAKTKY